MTRMGKKRRDLESRNCLSVKSVKSVVSISLVVGLPRCSAIYENSAFSTKFFPLCFLFAPVRILWLRLAAPSLRAFALKRLPQSHPVKPGQGKSNQVKPKPAISHNHHGWCNAPPNTPYVGAFVDNIAAMRQNSQTQSNPVKPEPDVASALCAESGQTNGVLEYWSNREMVKFSHFQSPHHSITPPQSSLIVSNRVIFYAPFAPFCGKSAIAGPQRSVGVLN